MSEFYAKELAHWTYSPPYDLYSMEETEESISELMDGFYRVVLEEDGSVVGFYCTGESAQVPAGIRCGAYVCSDIEVVDVGLGMKPDLTGRGLGSEFLRFILTEVMATHPTARLRLTVATFNQRAIRLYENFGFERSAEFEQNGIVYQTMYRR